ncbi:MAG: helix-turn-helix domain-containing protein [Muribaculum sp.]|nr:helix-turn-helix domain-containing protein [Muribaculaceae bacterium]MCM1080398.1 helix-turn-helix domain-containing protein [Muribaculum sp.]
MPCCSKIVTTLLLLAAIVQPITAGNKSTVWREFPELSSQEVIAIKKDTNGCVWLGTTKGLCRFDGYTLRQFLTVRDNQVTSVAIDNMQNVWFGTQQGAYVLRSGSLTPEPVDTARISWKPVSNIYITPDENVWLTQRGYLRRYDINGKWQKDYTLSDRSSNPTTLSGFCFTRENELFITTYSPIVYRYDRFGDTFCSYSNLNDDQSLGKIIEDYRENCLWIADHSGHIFRFNHKSHDEAKRFVASTVTRPETPDVQMAVHDMTQDITNGNIWVAGRTHLMLFQKTTDGHLEPIVHKLSPMLGDGAVETLKALDDGIWMSTFGYRTMLLPYNSEKLHTTLFGWDTTEREPLIISIQEDETPGYYWVIQNRNGLVLYNSQNGSVFNNTDLPSSNGLRLYVASEIIPSSRHHGVWVLQQRSMAAHRLVNDNGKMVFEQTITPGAQVPDEATATTAMEDQSGNLWICSTDGAYRYNTTTGNLTGTAALGCYITDIAQENDGDIWLSTRNNGLVQVTPEGKSIIHTKLPDGIIALTSAHDGWLWCAYANGKVIGYKYSTGKISDITNRLPIQSTDVSDIAADIFGHVWIKTPAKLIEYSPSNQTYRTHHVSTLNTPVEVFLSKFSYGDDGHLTIGGIGGAEVFYPSNSLDRQNSRITVYITDIVDSSSANPIFSGTLGASNSEDSEFIFPNSTRNLEINFSTLNYKHISRVRYAYRMFPYEKEWNYTEEGVNTAFYNQLPHGNYQFQLRATDENGVMSDSFTSFNFVLTPPLHQTWWAYIIYVLLILAAAFVLVKLSLKFQRKKNETMWSDSSEMMKMRNYLQAPDPAQQPEFEQLDKALFDKCVAVIKENIADSNFSVDNFSSAMNMSRSTLSRKLKLIYGGTPLDLIRDIRMRQAKSLLANPALNVAEVSEAVGFPDRRYFSLLFKKSVGMSPSEYQRHVRENSPGNSVKANT